MMFVRVCPMFLDNLGSGCISSPYNGLNGWLHLWPSNTCNIRSLEIY